MQMLLNTIQDTGLLGLLSAAACPVGALAMLIICGLLIIGRRVTPVLGAAILALPMGIGILGVWLGEMLVFQAISTASAESRMTLVASGISQAVGMRMLCGTVAAILSVFTLFGCAIAVARQKPFGVKLPITTLILTVLICFTIFAGGAFTQNIGAALRGLLYLMCGTLVAVSLLSKDKASSGAHAGTLATVAFPIAIAGAEICSMAMASFANFEAIAHAPQIDQPWLTAEWIDGRTTQTHFALGALALSVPITIIGTTRTLEGSLRDVGVICALLYSLCAPTWLTINAEVSMMMFIDQLAAQE